MLHDPVFFWQKLSVFMPINVRITASRAQCCWNSIRRLKVVKLLTGWLVKQRQKLKGRNINHREHPSEMDFVFHWAGRDHWESSLNIKTQRVRRFRRLTQIKIRLKTQGSTAISGFHAGPAHNWIRWAYDMHSRISEFLKCFVGRFCVIDNVRNNHRWSAIL